MSDCFDHALDAYDSRDYGNREDNSYSSDYKYSRLFHHTTFTFVKIIRETDKSYFISIGIQEAIDTTFDMFTEPTDTFMNRKRKHMQDTIGVWIPKKIIRKIDTNTMIVHRKILVSCIDKAFAYRYPEIYKGE